ncbi:hypothetical protein MGN70_001237 [Eutypa lata]|nr:hypothetical protein MGN70_001237 [Eutypa lata]
MAPRIETDASSAQGQKDGKQQQIRQDQNLPKMKYQLLLASLLGKDGGRIGMDGALTTADVPPEFLGDVFMVGQVPIMSLQVDPRISYALYVPPAHYNADPAKNPTPAKLPLLVTIHGTTRIFTDVYEGMRPFADETPCAVLAPLFPAGIEGPHDVDSYKVFRSPTLQSDKALFAVLDEIAYRWPGIETNRFYMSGFSGGGQFAHRFLYLYPERLAGISVGAPGRVTNIDYNQTWPQGVRDVEQIFNVTVGPESIAKVPIQLVVGSEDTEVHGNEKFWEWISTVKSGSNTELLPMDQSRLQTLRDLQVSWRSLGIESQLDIVEGIKHEPAKARDTMLDFLRPLVQNRTGLD